ncbi:hypothetical protein CAPTEDRAFT_222882 [Capitella teleta]|uniref:Chitin-binding type-2 domain-containing protein n=1 Tax=Capitella teleta TaxID=283909 RepID=R7UGN5_CAPTE|nr:hypothetical protein CAPTEDRAFT_222882 [Capitella teleta]|eukprot:ELU02933.1 hypothetical protein CAPTEDRAFT_222882 [Capitella teleta]
MKAFVGVLLMALAINASAVKKVVKETKVSYGSRGKDLGYASNNMYHGQYQGKCGNDGFYYNDQSSFVICSSGNAYIQPCAPGSQNSGYNHYNKGSPYYYRDFCDVNLVDDGYTLKYGNNGYHGNNVHNTGYQAPHNLGYGAVHNTGYQKQNYGYNTYDAGYGYNSGYQGGYQNPGYGGYKRTEYTSYSAPQHNFGYH